MLAALAIGPILADTTPPPGAPTYSADSIANSAAGIAGFYAPNSFISIYGQNLAHTTRAIGPGDISAGMLPTALTGTGVRVLINGILADIWYVSPALVNVLIPNYLIAGPATIQLEVDGIAGPAVSVTLASTAPALFPLDTTTPIAVHLDGSLITLASPARAGEMIVLFATGLGATIPAQIPDMVAIAAAPIAARSGFSLLLNSKPVDASRIAYAGAAPGTAGVYQINLLLPDVLDPNPEIRLSTTERTSPAGIHVPTH